MWMRAVARVVAKLAADRLAEGRLRGTLEEVAARLWAEEGPVRSDAQWRAALSAEARRDTEEALRRADELAVEFGGNLSEAASLALRSYLGVVPSRVRLSQRRPDDPQGWTTPDWLIPRRAHDLMRFLPPAVPTFQPGAMPWDSADWELTDLLGIGGFGEVWKARNPLFPAVPPVVFKFCTLKRAEQMAFRHEAAILSHAIRERVHPGLIPLRATFLERQPPCLAFEYVEGGDLQQWFLGRAHPERPLSLRRVTRIVARLAAILAFLHRRNPPVVHRDLKPANILVRRRPGGRGGLEFLICDFGIGGLAVPSDPESTIQGRAGRSAAGLGDSTATTASDKLIQSARFQGSFTPGYASPQQARASTPSPRDDVFALGVVWHQLLVNDLNAFPPNDLSYRRIYERLDRGMTQSQMELVGSCFSSRADLRPPDAGALLQAMRKEFADFFPPPRRRVGQGGVQPEGSGGGSPSSGSRRLVEGGTAIRNGIRRLIGGSPRSDGGASATLESPRPPSSPPPSPPSASATASTVHDAPSPKASADPTANLLAAEPESRASREAQTLASTTSAAGSTLPHPSTLRHSWIRRAAGSSPGSSSTSTMAVATPPTPPTSPPSTSRRPSPTPLQDTASLLNPPVDPTTSDSTRGVSHPASDPGHETHPPSTIATEGFTMSARFDPPPSGSSSSVIRPEPPTTPPPPTAPLSSFESSDDSLDSLRGWDSDSSLEAASELGSVDPGAVSVSEVNLIAPMPGVWREDPEGGLRLDQPDHPRIASAKIHLSALRTCGSARVKALAKTLEAGLNQRFITQSALIEVTILCHGGGDDEELVKSATVKLFGLLPPALADLKGRPLVDDVTLAALYQRWIEAIVS